ncbi:hypothetical protein [Stenotrophomonas sp.]|uniref:hypothetical protein n=1 Tax=Stenotrophomonas sp. TaxID=69392 RepID=UPI0028A932F5|nr:hypothetical protein [Stenotrophomonas sp.]
MIDELKSHWPLIVQHPWDALWIFTVGVSLGLGAPAAWRKLFPDSSAKPAKTSALSKLWKKVVKRKFRPSQVQRQCIAGLRYYDHRPLTPEQLAQVLDGEYPVSDVTQALEQLDAEGWAHWSVDQDTHRSAYTLRGGGLDYARTHKMEVRPAKG